MTIDNKDSVNSRVSTSLLSTPFSLAPPPIKRFTFKNYSFHNDGGKVQGCILISVVRNVLYFTVSKLQDVWVIKIIYLSHCMCTNF